MALAVFDIGGSAVKHGLWHEQTLMQLNQFPTPATFEELQVAMKQVINSYPEPIEGVAISAPGAVNVAQRRIDGISAVPYIHHRPIYDDFEAFFQLPVTIENDANCAGICEIEIGAGKQAQQAVFVVIGTGIGGAIFINRKIYKGAHLFGGEFGLMQNRNGKSLSYNGTAVNTASRLSETLGKSLTGKDLFDLKEAGDQCATDALNTMYDNLAEALYNIQVSIDPEVIILGGGISARPELSNELHQRLQTLLADFGVPEIMPEIRPCEFQNNANLIGAALNFQNIVN
uniref:ROK family protein n=1 Tax=Candidatus Enterococcus willemsii TaxID=1857215 RepID=UPI00403F7D9F